MRYLDPGITVSKPRIAVHYARACGAQFDTLLTDPAQLRYGDVVVTGPFAAHYWAWLPLHITIEIVPDGGGVRRADPLTVALKQRSLPITYRQSPPKTTRAAGYAAYQEAVAWVEEVLRLPVWAQTVTVGDTIAPHTVVDTVDMGRAVLRHLASSPSWAWDLETDSLDPYKVTRRALAVADSDHAWYLTPLVTEQLQDIIVDLLRVHPARGSNLKYDQQVVATWTGLPPMEHAPAWDTQIMDALLRPDAFQHGLKSITRDWLKRDVLELDDLGGAEQFWSLPFTTQARYAAAGDARNSYDLVDTLLDKLTVANLTSYYTSIEAPVIPVLAEMELEGLPLDRVELARLTDSYQARSQRITEELATLGFDGNANADIQLAHYLYDELNLPVFVRTPKTQRGSVALDVLYRLQLFLTQERELGRCVDRELRAVQLVIEWSEVDKALSTFLLPPLESGASVFRFDVLQTAAKTGRLSTRPNSQNWPEAVRTICAARDGEELTDVDLAQVEPRVAAHLSQDPRMLRDFREGRDVYQSLGVDMGLPLTALGKHTQLRKNIKVVYLADQYGSSPQKIQDIALRQGTHIPLSEARSLQDGIHKARADFYTWRTKYVATCRASGVAIDPLFGRQRDLRHGLNAIDPGSRAAAEREAMNWPMQCGAGGILKLAMPAAQRLAKQSGGALLNQIHDELLMRTSTLTGSQRCDFNEALARILTTTVELDVPLLADVGYGHTWATAKSEA